MLSNTPYTIPDSAQSSIALAKILARVTADAATVDTAKAAIDDFLKGNINLYSLDGSNGFRLTESIVSDYPNYKVSSAGDFNGDGFDDVMIGVENSDSDIDSLGSSNLVSDAAYIVFGKNSGFGATLDLSNLNGSNGFRIDGINANVSNDFSISNAGDINADGFDDLVIGTTLYGPDSGYSGNAYVLFGKAAGFNASLDLSRLDGSNGFRVNGLAVAEDPGNFVSSAGDFNGDGFDDMILGSPVAHSSYLIFGKASGFDAVLNLTHLNADKGFRLDGIATGDTVNTAGDVNGDGFDDLIISAPYADLNGESSGSSYVVFGKAEGMNESLDLSSLDGSNGFRLDGEAAGDHAGYSISTAGDVNGDGFDDLIVGAPGVDPNDSSYVVFGKASGFSAVLGLSSLDGDNGFRLDGEREFSGAGSSVSGIGDFNGDGFDDLMIGAPNADPDGFRVGASYIVFGKESGFSASLNLSSLDGSNGLILKGPQLNGRLGDFISDAGDVNGDGLDDVIMSVSESDIAFFGSRSSYVVFGANFNNAVAFLGTSGDDHLTGGTAAAESFAAGDGNDLMTGGGGADVFHGGAGDDIIKVSGLDFRLVDGGAGSDTLALTGSGLNLNLADVRGKIDGIETIDLTGSGNNTLTVSRLDLLNLSDTSNTLTVDGNTGDILTGLGSGWVDGGISGAYHTYTFDAATLLIGTDVTIHFA
ncbi:MAG: FG-GAP repeat protein [Gammaproteobacteria bacterium]|nr:MAG: FG-GAP repeat protein [Gammaproteobacteria bacterium]